MIDQARARLADRLSRGTDNPDERRIGGDVEFVRSSAEELGFLEDGSVDMIVAGAFFFWVGDCFSVGVEELGGVV